MFDFSNSEIFRWMLVDTNDKKRYQVSTEQITLFIIYGCCHDNLIK